MNKRNRGMSLLSPALLWLLLFILAPLVIVLIVSLATRGPYGKTIYAFTLSNFLRALPFMILPIYVALDRLDLRLLEAAQDLGANKFWTFVKVTLPLSRPGLIAGIVLVFIPSLGAFITPDLLGGAKSVMIGNLIQNEYLVVRDWPLGSAISFSLMALVLLGVLAYFKTDGRLDRFEGGG